MKIRIVPFVFLVAFGFSILHNWPVLLHFANILLGLDHFKIGFAISIPIVLVAALNFVLMRDMVQNVLETNSGEAGSYLNTYSILWVILLGILPAVLIFFIKIEYPVRWYKGLLGRAASMLASLAIVGLVLAFYYQDYASVGRNNPTLNKEVVPANFVYETARGKNFSLNGYHKDTNPFTAKEEGLVSFHDIRSCGTATAVSVPCMFSNMGRNEFDDNKARNRDNLLDVLQHTKVSVLWKENDGGCKGVCSRVPTIEINPSDYPSLCDKQTCHDEVMLENLKAEVASMQGDKLVALHLIGSHGPTYYKRYPENFRHFMPDCPRSDIENCTDQELENTYDNTIRYTDHVIAQLIERLKQYESNYNTALIYLSDHGESLGALGLYLHGTPYKFAPDDQTRVPMQVWMSPGFIQEKGMDIDCLRANAQSKRYSHDNLFSSVLGLWEVNSQVYNPQLDMFQPCRATQ